jgi:diguanylate cyclase (GGDEF)-like protein
MEESGDFSVVGSSQQTDSAGQTNLGAESSKSWIKSWSKGFDDCLEHWSRHFVAPVDSTAQWLQRAEAIYERVSTQFATRPTGMLMARDKKPQRFKAPLPRLEDDLRELIMSAGSLDDLWRFFTGCLKSGGTPDLLCFSILDESNQFIRLRFLYDGNPPAAAKQRQELPSISLSDPGNHLVQSYQRKDTTFTPHLSRLGAELLACIPWAQELTRQGEEQFNLFSIPFVAGNRAVALLTLGFQELDGFSQAKLSFMYGLRDSLAQLIWNLILQERLKAQTQVDNLTGLLSYTCFQDVLERELDTAEQLYQALTVMIIDVDELQAINRSQGHAVGDAALCHLASTVRRLVRGVDTVARYGGDEIVLLLPETDRVRAVQVAAQLLAGFKVQLPANLSNLTVSIGHATYPDDIKNRSKLLKLAEQARHLAQYKSGLPQRGGEDIAPGQLSPGQSTCVAASEIDTLNDKTVMEIFASQVAKKYENIHVPGVYQALLSQIEKRSPALPNATASATEAPAPMITAKPDLLMLETITSLAGALDAKDRYTRGHSQAVANYAVALGHALGMSPTEVEELRAAGFLHDIGKIGIPETILCKNGPLNEKEWEIMKQHAVIGAQQILYPVASLRPLIPAVECHHENWDGSGHPHGYKGEKIPVSARIIAIVDAFHALTSDRCYRKALPVADARHILELSAGKSWDPHLLEIFFGILAQAAPKPSSDPVTNG